MKNIEKIRLCVLCSLIFCFMISGCFSGSETPEDVSIYYEFKQAKRIAIARKLLKAIPEDSIKNWVYVKRAVDGAPRILGEYYIKDDVVLFEPAIPFTPGFIYQLYIRDKKHSDIEIPFADGGDAPVVMSIYPIQDSLPENLLKVYIQFSHPMQEGVSADHILLMKENDTLKNVFLDLQPELWNHDRTVLTLWLDPGRIKRDLQPNQKMGPPLIAGGNYKLLVKSGWQAGNGLALQSTLVKEFFTTHRDTVSPDPGLWKIIVPEAGNKLSLTIKLNDYLDYQLLLSSIRIVDSNGKEIGGESSADPDGAVWVFRPTQDWLPGSYTIEIESKLEDLAGNNLNRLFDTDLAKPQKKDQQEIYRLPFKIK